MPNPNKKIRSCQKPLYCIKNWSAYEKALVQRGSITFWLSNDFEKVWCYAGAKQRGAQFVLTIRLRRKRRYQPESATQSPTQSATQSADPVIRLLSVLQQGALSAGELRAALKIKHRPTFRANYLHPALEAEFINYTIPDKPNSRLQKYRLTKKGEVYFKKQRGKKDRQKGKRT